MTEIQLSSLFEYRRVVNPFKINPHHPDKWLSHQYETVKFHDVDGTKFACMNKYLPCPLCEMGHENFVYKNFNVYLTLDGIHSVISQTHTPYKETKLGTFVAAVDKRYGNPYGNKVYKLMRMSPPELLLNSNSWFAQLRAELQLMTHVDK